MVSQSNTSDFVAWKRAPGDSDSEFSDDPVLLVNTHAGNSKSRLTMSLTPDLIEKFRKTTALNRTVQKAKDTLQALASELRHSQYTASVEVMHARNYMEVARRAI
jgi:hypothetical protein